MRILLITLLLLPLATYAQTPGQCEHGTARGTLNPDGSEVYAPLFNGGSLFYSPYAGYQRGYLIPGADGNIASGPSVLWIGGTVENQWRVSAAHYGQYEFWPGPLEPGAVLPNPADCSAYDRIFVVSRDDVERYLQTGEMTDDLRDWPAHLGAPVLDGDGDPNNYDLEAGDQPAIYGDQTAWWVMNDVGNVHEHTGSLPLGVEVQVTAFGVGEGILPLRQATFYRYLLINRNSVPIDSAYVSLWQDGNIGNGSDDVTGTDTTLAMIYTYNSDDSDYAYGIPPAQGTQLVQGPIGLLNGRDDDRDGSIDEGDERLGLTASSHFCGGCTNPETYMARTPAGYYNTMRGRWRDGTPYTASGYGYKTEGPITVYSFPGDPVEGACWSAMNDCAGGGVFGGRAYVAAHTGPFRLEPGERMEIVYAMPFAQGRSNLDSIIRLRQAAFATRAAWDIGFVAPSRVEAAAVPPEAPGGAGAVELAAPAPNPFTDWLTVRYSLPDAMPARITLLDVLGREVARLASGSQSAGPHEAELDTQRLPAGVYLVRFEVGTEARTFTVVKAR